MFALLDQGNSHRTAHQQNRGKDVRGFSTIQSVAVAMAGLGVLLMFYRE
jgi:hypothetical protein